MDNQFLRTELLLGKEKLELLGKKQVTIMGLGAVGSFVGEALVRSGVKNLHLIDFDKITESNINRCLLANTENIGKFKVEVAKTRYLKINPKANIKTSVFFCEKDTFRKIMDPKPDLIIDAIDSVNPKVSVLECISKEDVNVISSMGAALKEDPLKVRFGSIFKTKNCTLAKWVRKNLRKRDVKKEILCVYSEELPSNDALLTLEESYEEGKLKKGRDRRTLGSMIIIPGIFGLTIAHLAIKKLTEEKNT